MDAVAHVHSHDPIPSRWPIITALGVGLIPVGLVSWSHGWPQGLAVLLLGFAIMIFGAGSWWGELLHDRFFGRDAVDAERRLKTAMFFFIASEAAIFCSFFAALIYARVHSPTWPPEGMPHFEILVPAVNTFILLFSSVTLHLGHSALERNRRDGVIASILMTISLGAIFLCGQAYEYGFLNGSAFNIRSGIFGSTFFMLTGFHGLHVLVGLIFLNVVYGAVLRGQITPQQHFPFKASSWYWHFVDVVWIFVFTIVYIL
ncbi:MAG TPA: cytochrome c oxidase subunit 3 [Methylomirabilota bacterium]|nr:cytochrome c oxidase subunit 3 [Methylomirabilota bacterium]